MRSLGGVNLAQGVCDTPASRGMAAATAGHRRGQQYLHAARRHRAAAAGHCRQPARHNGITADPDGEILVASGATGAFYAACHGAARSGRRSHPFRAVLRLPPEHARSPCACRLAPRAAGRTGTGRWTWTRCASAITPRTRAPSSSTRRRIPCGKVFSRPELEAVAALALEHDLFVITDEIYEYFRLRWRARHISLATMPAWRNAPSPISGLSKTFSITGWRVGYLTAAANGCRHRLFPRSGLRLYAPSPFQYATAAGLRALPDEFYAATVTRVSGEARPALRRAYGMPALLRLVPAGAYYVLADVDSDSRATAPARKPASASGHTGVGAVAGSAFFSNAAGGTTCSAFVSPSRPQTSIGPARLCGALANDPFFRPEDSGCDLPCCSASVGCSEP